MRERRKQVAEYVVLDFETANPKRVSACSVGGCVISDGAIVDKFATFIKPPPDAANFAPINVRIHGITPDKVADAPTFGELLPKFMARVDGRTVLAYSTFDRSVIDNLLNYYGGCCQYQYVDVCELAKERIPGLKNYKLPTVAKHLGLDAFKHHDAIEDALACARVFLALNGQDEPVPTSAKEITTTEGMTQGEVEKIFSGFVDCITDDGVIDYKEATELFYFLAVMPQTNMVGIIRENLFDILEDDKVDQYESDRLIAQLKYAKSHLFD